MYVHMQHDELGIKKKLKKKKKKYCNPCKSVGEAKKKN